MHWLDVLLHMKVRCATCGEFCFKRDCVEYRLDMWAGTSHKYECKTCDVVRKLEGKPNLEVQYWERVKEVLNRPRNMGT